MLLQDLQRKGFFTQTLRLNPSFTVEQWWPYLFVKEGKYSLKIFLEKVLSHSWKLSSPEDNPQVRHPSLFHPSNDSI